MLGYANIQLNNVFTNENLIKNPTNTFLLNRIGTDDSGDTGLN